MSCNCPGNPTPVRGKLLFSIDPLSVTFVPFTDQVLAPEQIHVRYWTVRDFLEEYGSGMTEERFFRVFRNEPLLSLVVDLCHGRLEHFGIDPRLACTNTIFVNRLERNNQ